MARVAVLGAGLQGACLALELAASGIDVDLYDKCESCVAQASCHNEGKIHLGYVYANDPTLNTARMLVRGALAFSPLMRRWIGAEIEKIPVSTPFYYAVHRDSMVPIDDVQRHLARCSSIVREVLCARPVDYFGVDCRQPPARLTDCDGLFDRRSIAAAFKTPEIGIDAEALAACVRARLASEPRIRRLMRSAVLDAAIHDSRVSVEFETGNDRFTESYDHVVNTLWEGRLAIDAAVGLRPPRPWSFRLKHYLRGRAPQVPGGVPSTTIVLGPFGDVVAYSNGEVLLSWYPAGMTGMSSDLTPPDWPRVLDEPAETILRKSIVDGLAGVIPRIAAMTSSLMDSSHVRNGIIFAWGATDITDPASTLHSRHAIGPRSFGRYHSIDTGKLTMAPLFAKITADRIRAA